MKKTKGVNIHPIKNPEGAYRFEIQDLAWREMMFGHPPQITPEEYHLYEKWFWELAK